MKNVFMVLDTESIGLVNKYVYDIAYQIVDKNGTIYSTYSSMVEEICTNPDLMKDAFYHKKIYSHYLPMLSKGEISINKWNNILSQMTKDIKEFNVNVICAYNLGFDIGAMRETHKYITGKDVKFGNKFKNLDIWQFACETILSAKTFKKLATEKGWISEKGNIRTNAEVSYRYVSGNWEFDEEHTALKDVIIEVKILMSCLRQKKKIPYGKINQQPWKIVNR